MPENSQTRMATVRCPICSTLNRVDLSRLKHHPKCAHCGKPILLDRPIAVTDEDLERVVADAEVPVIVDFYADWCGPCKMMAPIFDEFARERAGQALVAKLNTDRNPAMTDRFGIRGIPTLVVFRGGREVARQVGAVPKPRLEALLASAEQPTAARG
ncbi:MAG: thioredoxin TrxC [Chloroflexota bacterium]|nr:thioredoxin TrxC [Chloroflexota bacterium]